MEHWADMNSVNDRLSTLGAYLKQKLLDGRLVEPGRLLKKLKKNKKKCQARKFLTKITKFLPKFLP